jgi:hypothetical protein
MICAARAPGFPSFPNLPIVEEYDQMKPIMTNDLLDQVSRIYERARVEVLTLLRSREPAEQPMVPQREWMSATQLAEYGSSTTKTLSRPLPEY